MLDYLSYDSEPVKPDTSNQIKFHGTMEEFKNYLPELYDKMIKEGNEK